MTIAYRTPTLADAEALTALGRRSFVETFGHLYARADLDTFLTEVFGPKGMPVELAGNAYTFRVAEDDADLIGYCKVGPLFLPAPDDGRGKIELCQLYVLKPWQGTGVAAALMDWALAHARAKGHDDMYLSVWSENHRAQRFYARYGFEEVGRHDFMVGSQADDDRIWRLKLRE
ncbi:MAG: GNAT family N-acetyltransferase [Pseudomonadota bacterium]